MQDERQREPTAAELRRQLETERQRMDWLMSFLHQHGSVLARIEQRCIAIETRMQSAPQPLTTVQWLKVVAGLGLPLLVLLLTGNAELARKFVVGF